MIGGGKTGTGIIGEATRSGLRVLLVEGLDFTSPKSSRSSKLVHDGFRYLKNGEIKLTLKSWDEFIWESEVTDYTALWKILPLRLVK